MAAMPSVLEKGKLAITLPEKFDFHCRNEFRQTYEGVAGVAFYELDFSRVRKVDSSALGMLLILRDYIGGSGDRISLVNLRPEIRALVTIAQFQQLFTIS